MNALKASKTKVSGDVNLKKVSSISETPKTVEDLPKGAIVLKNDVSIAVEEIENGFLICKNYDIKYQLPNKDGGSSYPDYLYYTKKYYSEENPLEIRTDDKSLADLFD